MRKPSARTLTVRELREALEDFPEHMPVVLVADYGDIMHTQQALPIISLDSGMTVTESAYSHSGWELVEMDQAGSNRRDDDEEEEYVALYSQEPR